MIKSRVDGKGNTPSAGSLGRKAQKDMAADQYTYVCVALHAWGTGPTVLKAVANCRKAFGPGMKTYLVRRYPAASNPRVHTTDGSVEYDGSYGDSLLVRAVKNGEEMQQFNGKPVFSEE